MIAAVPSTSDMTPAKITQPRMFPSFSPPVNSAADIVCELMTSFLLLVCGVFHGFLDGCERLYERRLRLVHDDLPQDGALGAGQAVLLGALERYQVEAVPARRVVAHADRDVERGVEVVARGQVLGRGGRGARGRGGVGSAGSSAEP